MTQEVLDDTVAAMLRQTPNHRALTETTVNRLMETLRSVLLFAKYKGEIEGDLPIHDKFDETTPASTFSPATRRTSYWPRSSRGTASRTAPRADTRAGGTRRTTTTCSCSCWTWAVAYAPAWT